MEDKREILKTLIRKAENRVLALEMEKKSTQDALDECTTALDGYKDQLDRLDEAVFIQVPTNGQTKIVYPQNMIGG